MTSRHTIIAHGHLARDAPRLEAARSRLHGRQIMTFEALACRLAGGFASAIDDDALRGALQRVLPGTELGELEAIKLLPGMVDAAAGTLRKVWRSGIDLQIRVDQHPRLRAIGKLEEAVLGELPPSQRRPADLVYDGMKRLDHAATLFGPIEIVGITELSPCWRPLLLALATRTPVRWLAGPRSVPKWLFGSAVAVERSTASSPEVSAVSTATAYHEVIEAMRWARRLLASGAAKPAEIGIAAAIPADYDDHFLALRSETHFDIHFAHGVKLTATREGQTAAALADILLRGLSRTRLRRLAALIGDTGGLFERLPEGWVKILPDDAPLATPDAWKRFLERLKAEDWPDGQNHSGQLRPIVDLLQGGTDAAAAAGEALLTGQALKIWRKALLAGHAASLDITLGAMKQGDGLEGSVCAAWMPASELAAAPRRFARLLGLNSSRWPRGLSEDRLLSDHVLPTSELDPLPVADADRRDFETILATTQSEVVLSRSRRDSEGRLLGRSPLLQGQPSETYVRRNVVPIHAMSESDRILARPDEFKDVAQAISAAGCWKDWRRAELTKHDGLVRPDHPVVLAVLDRVQSASSLRALLRYPLGFLWKYGLHWRSPESGAEPLTLDALELGNLIHAVLDRSLRAIEPKATLATAAPEAIASAVEAAASEVAGEWEAERSVPPPVIWRKTVDEVRALADQALSNKQDALPNAHSFGEVPFGGSEPRSDGDLPWDAKKPVALPGTEFHIAGYIDRLDLSSDGRRASVRDYKTGKTAKQGIVLDGGRELQRCLYAAAVKALLGDAVPVSASLFFPRDLTDLKLEDPDAALERLANYLRLSHASLKAGVAVIGEDAGGDYDDLAFALPANPKAFYLGRKLLATQQRLGDAAKVWEAE